MVLGVEIVRLDLKYGHIFIGAIDIGEKRMFWRNSIVDR